MSYTHYRDGPGWGTQQYQFAAPPTPSYRPESTWRGRDYYNAAAVSPDLGVFDTAYNRVRTGGSGFGVGFREARDAHRRAYGGLGELEVMLANDLGAAAGYEAYRNWIHNSSVFEPARFDDERQREALIGLAMAEATRLWHSAGRRMDRFGMQQACEAAAATVSVIMEQWREPYGGNSSPYMDSFNGGMDPYASDDVAFSRLRSGHHRRRSSANSPRPTLINIGGGAGPMQIPGAQPAYGMPYNSTPIPIAGSAGGVSPYGASAGMPLSVSPYGSSAPQLMNTVPQAVYATQPSQVYPSSVPSQSTVIIPAPSSSSRHHSHHHKRRSSSRTRDREREREREREKDYRRSRRYSDASLSSQYYGQPQPQPTLIAAPRVMTSGGVAYGAPPSIAPSYTTAYRY